MHLCFDAASAMPGLTFLPPLGHIGDGLGVYGPFMPTTELQHRLLTLLCRSLTHTTHRMRFTKRESGRDLMIGGRRSVETPTSRPQVDLVRSASGGAHSALALNRSLVLR
jgi:hypothetical protein